jgi:hypothetical protein
MFHPRPPSSNDGLTITFPALSTGAAAKQMPEKTNVIKNETVRIRILYDMSFRENTEAPIKYYTAPPVNRTPAVMSSDGTV